MADAIRTVASLLGDIPDAVKRASGNAARGLVRYQAVRDLLQSLRAWVFGMALTRVLGDGTTGGVTTDGATKTIAAYQIDMSAVSVLVGGVLGEIGALNDQSICGTSAWSKSYTLDGTAPSVLSADGKTYEVALVAVLVSGAVQLHAVFGDEADDGDEVAPTASQIRAALVAANIAGLDASVGLVVTRLKIKRVATDTITYTHGAPGSNAALRQERLVGSLYGVVPAT